MKKIILSLGIAAMACTSATAQTTNTGSTIPPNTSTSTLNGGRPNNSVPGGYKTPNTTKPNTNYQSHYKQGTKTPANSNTTSPGTPMSPTVTTPNPVKQQL